MFAVRGTDAVGNTDATPATSSFRIETPAPPAPTGGGTPPPRRPGPHSPVLRRGPPTPPGPAARPAPFTLTAGLPRIVRSRTGVRVAVLLRCSEPCRSRVRVRIPAALARTLGLRGPRVGRQVVVAASRAPTRAGTSRRVTVLLPRALVRRPSATLLTVTAAATTPAGRSLTRAIGRVRLAPRR